ncbi:MAG: hypothetical protein ACKOSQ_06545 [Planctomycetaceae bacterium]
MSVRTSFILAVVACGTVPAATAGGADERPTRPQMRQLQPTRPGGLPPSDRELVDARAVIERRFREPLAHTGTAAGASAAATMLLDAATAEEEPAVKWALLVEARRLAAAAGNAAGVDRAIVLADATFEFDAIKAEQHALRGIPLRALDRSRAAQLAQVAEGLAERAEADGRPEVAADSWALAMRGWQRAGDLAAARRAATRLGDVERTVPRGLP